MASCSCEVHIVDSTIRFRDDEKVILTRCAFWMMASGMPPSVTLSSRIFNAIGVTEVIGSTPSTFTSPSCSTKAKMTFSSP